MYTVSDAVEMGSAQELILSLIKVVFVQDDTRANTEEPEEYFDQ